MAKRGYVSNSDQTEVIQCVLYKPENWLPMADHFCVSLMLSALAVSACPAIARAGGCKRTCFPCCCSCTCIWQNRFCLVFSKKFNIMSALSAHQSLTLPQKIDSREGLFWCKKGVVCAYGKMNFYLKEPPFAPFSELFGAKCSAFWC